MALGLGIMRGGSSGGVAALPAPTDLAPQTGAQAHVAAAGETITSTAGASVCDGSSKLLAGLGANVLGVGRALDSNAYGYLIDGIGVSNTIVANAGNTRDPSAWSAGGSGGTVAFSASRLTGPDGSTGSKRCTISSGGFSAAPHAALGTTPQTVSCWALTQSASNLELNFGTNETYYAGWALTPNWRRFIATTGGTGRLEIRIDGRALTAYVLATGTPTPIDVGAGARDVTVDFLMSGSAGIDAAYHSSGAVSATVNSLPITANSAHLYQKCHPSHSRANGSATQYPFKQDANNYLACTSAGVITLVVASTTLVTSATAQASYAQNGTIEWHIDWSLGLVEYRIDGAGLFVTAGTFSPINNGACPWTSATIGMGVYGYYPTRLSTTMPVDNGGRTFAIHTDDLLDPVGTHAPQSRIAVQTVATEAIALFTPTYSGGDSTAEGAILSAGALVQSVQGTQNTLTSIYASGMASTSKVVETRDGFNQRAFSAGAWYTRSTQFDRLWVRDPGAANVALARPSKRLVVYGDSRCSGGLATHESTQAWVNLIRANTGYRVTNYSAGSLALWDDYTNIGPTATAAKIASALDGTALNVVWIDLQYNDNARALWTAAAYATAMVALVTAINAAAPANTLIYVASCYTCSPDTGLPAFRSALSTALSTAAIVGVTYADETAWVDVSAHLADGVHPDTTGHANWATYIQATIP